MESIKTVLKLVTKNEVNERTEKLVPGKGRRKEKKQQKKRSSTSASRKYGERKEGRIRTIPTAPGK